MEFLLDTLKRDRAGDPVQVPVWVPPEVLEHIVNMLDYNELAYVRQVSHTLYDMVDHICQRRRGCGLRPTLPTGGMLCYTWRGAGRGAQRILDACAINYPKAKRILCREAAATGQLALVKLAYKNGCDLTTETVSTAAYLGKTDIMDFAHQNGGFIWDDDDYMYRAGLRGHDNVMQYLHDRDGYFTCNLNKLVRTALPNGHIHILARYWSRFCNVDRDIVMHAITAAAKAGHIAAVKWAITSFYIDASELSGRVCTYVAGHKDLAAVQWLRERGAEWCNLTCAYAAGVDLATLKWVHANGAPMQETAFCYAAEEGLIDVLEWLVQVAPSDMLTDDLYDQMIEMAARHGHFDAVQWIAKRYAPHRRCVMKPAVRGGHVHIAKWACRSLVIDESDDELFGGDMLKMGVRSGSLRVVQWLWKKVQGHADEDVIRLATYYADGIILDWLREQGAPWDGKMCTHAEDCGLGFGNAMTYHAHCRRTPREMPCGGTCDYGRHTSRIKSHYECKTLPEWYIS